jgi:subtilisin family serine protease
MPGTDADTVRDVAEEAITAGFVLGDLQTIDPHTVARAHELLAVVGADYGSLTRDLEAAGGVPYVPQDGDDRAAAYGIERADINARLERSGVPVRLWTFQEDVDVTDVQRRFAQRGVHRNHTQLGAQKMTGVGGVGTAVPTAPGVLPDIPVDAEPTLAVLDTGLPAQWQDWFPSLQGAVRPFSVANRTDDPTADFDHDQTVGHGLFVSGIVRQVEPTVAMTVRRVLRWRLADEAFLAAELAEVTEPVVNLSIVAVCEGGAAAPVGLRAAIEKLLEDGKVVVAAAGNGLPVAIEDEPGGSVGGVVHEFWPAMLKGVIAVGALDTRSTSTPPTVASFSNRGRFVDVWAPGVRVRSTFLKDFTLTVRAPSPSESAAAGHPVFDETTVRFDGWATWDGTSFAAPMVAARIARLVADDGGKRTPAQIAREFLDGLPPSDLPGEGRLFDPQVPGLVGS